MCSRAPILVDFLQVISAACAAFCSLAKTCSEAADKLLTSAVYYHEALRRFLSMGSFREGQPPLQPEVATVYILRWDQSSTVLAVMKLEQAAG